VVRRVPEPASQGSIAAALAAFEDLGPLPDFPLPRRMILWAVERSGGVTAVCQALKDHLVKVGAPAKKVRVVLHGVDLELFRPVDREAVRARLGLSGRVLLSVGHVTKRKGQHLVVQALARLPGAPANAAATSGTSRTA